MLRSLLIVCWTLNYLISLDAQRILNVGPGQTYANPAAAAAVALPGDLIRIHPATYQGSFFINNLKGTANAWIRIEGTQRDQVIFQGGSESMHFTDAEYLHISNITVRGQTGNGMNIDDAGTFESPTKFIIIEHCTFRDMAATGNNDLLKLSGLDSFTIQHCHFENGSAGGSGIDMVGCHAGIIRNNRFIQMGSNSIQAKGASSQIQILANYFTQGGQRTLNLGGSTGAAFFRPSGANYEAKDLLAAANVFEGSTAPVAFVGCRNVVVTNNTIIRPDRWILRILQESSDTSFYQSCANNRFVNNIVVVNNQLSTDLNIGPNTSPSTFQFANNLWYHLDNAGWRGPQLPATETQGIVQQNPQFVNFNGANYHLLNTSPAIGKGRNEPLALLDFDGNGFLNPRSIGAFEGGKLTNVSEDEQSWIALYPNPVSAQLHLPKSTAKLQYTIVRMDGSVIRTGTYQPTDQGMDVSLLPSGAYIIQWYQDHQFAYGRFIKQ